MELVVSSLHMKEGNFWPTELFPPLVPALQCTSKMFGVTARSVALPRMKVFHVPIIHSTHRASECFYADQGPSQVRIGFSSHLLDTDRKSLALGKQ